MGRTHGIGPRMHRVSHGSSHVDDCVPADLDDLPTSGERGVGTRFVCDAGNGEVEY